MQLRTDLAIENHELLEEARAKATGYIKKHSQVDEDIAVTDIEIISPAGEKAFGKKMFELYLYHEGYGIKDHLAGVLEETLEEYEESIEDVIAQDLIENICNYYTDHMKPSFVDEKTAVEQFINSFDK